MTRAWVGSGEDDVGEDGQGQLAVPEHVVVEAPDVEGGALPALPLSAEALDLAPAGQGGERLARPRDVAIGLARGVGGVDAGRDHRLGRLLSAPAERVEPGIDHPTVGAERLADHRPEALTLAPKEARL